MEIGNLLGPYGVKKYVAFLLVALDASSATISFRHYPELVFDTLSIRIDSLYVLVKRSFCIVGRCDHAFSKQGLAFCDKYCVNGWLESITLFFY